ncbi:MAG: sugar O-acyltransferase, sialic acid O-acetyltransferase NeuD family [Ferruginibacter sp.]|nr:sugar O-acyltransferase, sialic acid O-acetyltransferase NeuD family [Ferruginibacter sp.]
MILIGYSGHAFVAYSIAMAMGKTIAGYCDNEEKEFNPFSLEYAGPESGEKAISLFAVQEFFIAIGNNPTRKKIAEMLAGKGFYAANLIHPTAVVCPTASIGIHGVMIGSQVSVNALAMIGNGVICNTSSVIEHECILGDYVHLAPGAVLCGNVTVGEGSFIGAGSVIRQGISIGKNVTIGAGSVVVKNIADNEIVAGNPARTFSK